MFAFCRNEKRRIESTGEAPTWQYYHEVDELLGSHNDHSLDLSNLDDSNVANSSLISKYLTVFFSHFQFFVSFSSLAISCKIFQIQFHFRFVFPF